MDKAYIALYYAGPHLACSGEEGTPPHGDNKKRTPQTRQAKPRTRVVGRKGHHMGGNPRKRPKKTGIINSCEVSNQDFYDFSKFTENNMNDIMTFFTSTVLFEE